jgi:dihydrofolate synthase/folylpolyglutamate synthase
VITGVDIDHTEYLGSTIAMIAGEKVAILKPDGTVVSGPLPDEALAVLAARVEETGSRWVRLDDDFSVLDAVVGVGGWLCTVSGVYDTYDDVFLPLHGRHQVDHLATAIASSEMFLGRALDLDLLVAAAASVTSPGRLEVVGRRPIVILDGAHNRQGFLGLSATLDEEFPPVQWKLVLGLRGNREVSDLLTVLKGRVDRVYATAAADSASHDAVELAERAAAVLGVEGSAFADPLEAVEAARIAAGPDGGVIVAGSLYLVGEVHDALAGPARRPSDVHVRYDAQALLDAVDDEDVEEEEDIYDG